MLGNLSKDICFCDKEQFESVLESNKRIENFQQNHGRTMESDMIVLALLDHNPVSPGPSRGLAHSALD